MKYMKNTVEKIKQELKENIRPENIEDIEFLLKRLATPETK